MSTTIDSATCVYVTGAWSLTIRTVTGPRAIAPSGAITTALAGVVTALTAQLGAAVQAASLYYFDGHWRVTGTTNAAAGIVQNDLPLGDNLQQALTTLLLAINIVTPSSATFAVPMPGDGSTDQIAANSGNN